MRIVNDPESLSGHQDEGAIRVNPIDHAQSQVLAPQHVSLCGNRCQRLARGSHQTPTRKRGQLGSAGQTNFGLPEWIWWIVILKIREPKSLDHPPGRGDVDHALVGVKKEAAGRLGQRL